MRPLLPLISTLLLALGGCAGQVALDPMADVREARRLLAQTAEAGPVPVVVRGEAPLAMPDLLRAVEQGVHGLAIEARRRDGPRRLVLDFSGTGAALCDDPAEGRAIPDPGVIRAAFCDGSRAVAAVSAERTGSPERLIWRLVGRLVPDDYPDTYGFDLLGNRVTIGGGVSF